MSEQLPLQGPVKQTCACGCGLFGSPKRKAFGDGLRHIRGCECRRCRGSHYARNAGRRERRIASDLGGAREPFSGALSGADVKAGGWSFEETSNEAVVRGFRRWWTSKTLRRKTARLFARHGEAHALILSWDGRCQVVITAYDDFVGQFGDGRTP